MTHKLIDRLTRWRRRITRVPLDYPLTTFWMFLALALIATITPQLFVLFVPLVIFQYLLAWHIHDLEAKGVHRHRD